MLVATARDPRALGDLVECYGDRVRAAALDVTEPRAVVDAVALAVDAFGRLDVLVNNAGYGNVAPIEDTTLAEFRAQIETNLFGVINLTKAALPVMRRQASGHILQLSSIGGRVGPVGRAPYAAAKWGVEGFSEVLAKEVGPHGVKVTILEPGGFRTDVPTKAAAAILDVASLEKLPLRLLLGSDAMRAAEQAALARAESDRTWRGLSASKPMSGRRGFRNPESGRMSPRRHGVRCPTLLG